MFNNSMNALQNTVYNEYFIIFTLIIISIVDFIHACLSQHPRLIKILTLQRLETVS